MTKITSLLFSIMLSISIYCQSTIEVFSEKGEKFSLIINGIKQNESPQYRVFVQGLENDSYYVHIIFENGKKLSDKIITRTTDGKYLQLSIVVSSDNENNYFLKQIGSLTELTNDEIKNMLLNCKKEKKENRFSYLKDNLMNKCYYTKQVNDFVNVLPNGEGIYFVIFSYDHLLDKDNFDLLDRIIESSSSEEDLIAFWKYSLSKKEKEDCLIILNKCLYNEAITLNGCMAKIASQEKEFDITKNNPSLAGGNIEINDKVISINFAFGHSWGTTATYIAIAAYERIQAICNEINKGNNN